MKKTNLFLNITLGLLVKVFSIFKGQRIIKKTNIKGPAVILSNHTSFYDFIYTSAAMYPKRVSYLAANKMFYEPVTGFFLRLARAIPKSLMQSDPIATLKAFRILKLNGIVSIFPEGQISPMGKTIGISFAIAKFLKKANVDVYIVKHMGAGLVNPPWTKRSFKGKIETIKELIIDKETLSKLNYEEIYQIVVDKLDYSQSKYNFSKKYIYKLNDISNLENVIYECPNCFSEGLLADKHKLICKNCHYELNYDQYGLLNQQGVDELFVNQQNRLRSKIDDDNNFEFTCKTSLMSFRNNRLVEVGNGNLSVKRYLYTYKGTIDNQYQELKFNVSSTPTLPSDIGRNVQIYEANQIYQFEIKERYIPTKIVHIGEYLFELYNKKV